MIGTRSEFTTIAELITTQKEGIVETLAATNIALQIMERVVEITVELSGIARFRFVAADVLDAKLYIPSTLNIDLLLWHTKLIVCAENVKPWFKAWVFPFTFQAYILPH